MKWNDDRYPFVLKKKLYDIYAFSKTYDLNPLFSASELFFFFTMVVALFLKLLLLLTLLILLIFHLSFFKGPKEATFSMKNIFRSRQTWKHLQKATEIHCRCISELFWKRQNDARENVQKEKALLENSVKTKNSSNLTKSANKFILKISSHKIVENNRACTTSYRTNLG